MKIKKETIYRCDHCNKPYYSRSHCKEHEAKCLKDPKNKGCYSCEHYFGECARAILPAKREQVGEADLYRNCSGFKYYDPLSYDPFSNGDEPA